ncbi:hypothetical protein J6590_017624, partial [Homalodisca vitripennis]
ERYIWFDWAAHNAAVNYLGPVAGGLSQEIRPCTVPVLWLLAIYCNADRKSLILIVYRQIIPV